MNAHSPPKLSLIERAAQVYDFDAPLRIDGSASLPARDVDDDWTATPARRADGNVFAEPAGLVALEASLKARSPRTVPSSLNGMPLQGSVDRVQLEARGFILPDAPVDTLSEEFRIIKRGLLSHVRAKGEGKGQIVMVCSARPDDGKTFTAVNLGLSLAGERDVEVLLIDGDVAKPEILSTLGLEGEVGLLDALADPAVDVERLVIRTDVGGLSVLPAGRQAHGATEMLSSSRMSDILRTLTVGHPDRIVLFDSPPALAASAASAIAGHVGQVLLVVRADRTSDADLREAVGLVGACGDIKLVLNGAPQPRGNKRFSYYGAGR